MTDYYRAAETWEKNLDRVRSRSLKFAWIVAGCSTLISLMALACLVLLLPLKTFEPYVIEVDKSTGYLEVKRPLASGEISQLEAVTKMNVARFILARETYDQATLAQDFRITQIFARSTALSDYLALYDPSNRANPVNLYERRFRVLPTVKSIELRDERTAIVRFSTLTTGANSTETAEWQGVVSFSYTDAPLTNETRFVNPLGFLVTDYRREREGGSS